MTLGYIGLGKMGLNMVLRLKEKGHKVVAYNRSPEPRKKAQKNGIETVSTIPELISKLHAPRLIWIMVSHSGVDAVVRELIPLLSKGDIIVDGGNCFYKDTLKRAALLKKHGISFLDVGVSGGPAGARNGACSMVGGEKKDFQRLLPLFKDISAPGAYLHCGSHGAGHFVKMVHNGIEYGMMQALAEGFEVLKFSKFKLDLEKVALIYNNRSVIESRLVEWLGDGLRKYGKDLKTISSTVSHTGEGEWTVTSAKEFGVSVPIIKSSLDVRKQSAKNPRFAGKVLSVLRNQFGGHDAAMAKKS